MQQEEDMQQAIEELQQKDNIEDVISSSIPNI